ncbi:MAG: imidazole glycerol phosphate synthase subunit HisH [Pseudomonadota bacterium]|nr:imidazole glycerol phosphate synthase subunit HisH [Pseudomonadota bacterium]
MTKAKVGVVYTGVANLNSLVGALKQLDIDYVVVKKEKDLSKATHLILPGDGSFDAGCHSLRESGLDDAILRWCDDSKAFLGICLGMQLMATYSAEGGGQVAGLGLIQESVEKLDKEETERFWPHIGWNKLDRFHAQSDPILSDIEEGAAFYFIHGYCIGLCDRTLASTVYGDAFSAIIARENLYGVQFHPEKSQKNGLVLLSNFASKIHD